MAANSSNLVKDKFVDSRSSTKPNRINPNKTMLRWILANLLRAKDKEKNLESS